MLVSDIYQEIRSELQTNSTKVPDATLLVGVNIDYGELVMEALRARGDYNFQMNEANTDLISTSGLVAGDNGFNGEYAWATDVLKPTRLEVSFDGTNFYPATVYDVTDKISKSEHYATDINNTFQQTNPYVRFERNSYFIRPLKTTAGNVTAGIHVWYEQRQATLTASDTPSIEPNYHRLFVLKGALRIMRKFRTEYTVNDRQEVKNEINELTAKMNQFYSKQIDENVNLTTKFVNYA